MATNGSCAVVLPNVNVGNVDVDFKTAIRSMRGGIIRVEEIGGVAYTLTTLSPDGGGGFNVTGGTDTGIQEMDVRTESVVYDLLGRELSADDDGVGIVIKGGKKFYRK